MFPIFAMFPIFRTARGVVRTARQTALLMFVWAGAIAGAQAQVMPSLATADSQQSAAPKGLSSAAGVAGCPNRGGILDSVSVPVGQPLNLVVRISAPAPRGGAAFQTSSDDPSIVAAGDRRQAFLPRVFIPEGQFLSNPFTIFGIKIGGTRLRLIALTPGFGSGSFPLGAWDINRGGDERFVDANAASKTCRASDTSNDLATDPARLSQCGAAVKGVAADAISQLLLRGISGLPGTMCYEITSTSAFGQGTVQTPLLTTRRVGNLEYGFSFYKAPEAFEDTADFRNLEVEFTFTPSIGNGNTTKFRAQTKILRPPVILVHGVWSKAGAWGGDYKRNDAFRTTEVADYSGTNGAHYSTNSPLIQDFIGRGLKATRDKGYAVTQADVMGHSMGGILTRLHIMSDKFKRPDNFGKGDVRRLITLDTPHSGSTFPNLVTVLHRLKPTAADAAVKSITKYTPQGGAICDLAENSPALMGLNSATPIKGQAITGTGGPAGTAAVPAQFFGGFLSFGNIEGELTKTVCLRRNLFFQCVQEESVFPQNVVDGFRFRQANDTIVSLVSQQGGRCDTAGLAGINFADVIHSGPGVVNGVLATDAVAARAYQLLDGPASALVGSFPGVASTGIGAACTVPGRGAVQDAQDYADQCGAGGALNSAVSATSRRAALGAGRHMRALANAPDARVQIVSPAAGQVFAPGDTVNITVRLAPPLVANDIAVQIPGFNTLPGMQYDGVTYQAAFTIPNDFAGPLVLTPAVTDTDNLPLEGAAVAVAVRSAVPPTAISFAQKNFRFTPQSVGPAEALALFGTYPGPVTRDISSAAAGTTYTSSNPGVVSVNADGVRQVSGSGIAVIAASNSGLLDYAVFVVEDPANPLPANEVTGQLSIQQSGLRLDRASGFFVQSITVANTQVMPIAGPVYLVLAGLPAGVNLVNQSGLTQAVRAGSPYLTIPLVSDGLSMQPGQSVNFTAQFLNPTRVNFNYIASVWRVTPGP